MCAPKYAEQIFVKGYNTPPPRRHSFPNFNPPKKIQLGKQLSIATAYGNVGDSRWKVARKSENSVKT